MDAGGFELRPSRSTPPPPCQCFYSLLHLLAPHILLQSKSTRSSLCLLYGPREGEVELPFKSPQGAAALDPTPPHHHTRPGSPNCRNEVGRGRQAGRHTAKCVGHIWPLSLRLWKVPIFQARQVELYTGEVARLRHQPRRPGRELPRGNKRHGQHLGWLPVQDYCHRGGLAGCPSRRRGPLTQGG